ncbi:MAG: hypothetical protein Ct9H300mP9_4980 [Candidatus Neomarinimicrobiota bacterium]|nr:MAG: hypothetical protein Ct9H300mP9_4980 [Candidatus Neomarinimicrobiota bacterium]
MSVHVSNTRAACVGVENKQKDQEPWFGIEQEYTFFNGTYPFGVPRARVTLLRREILLGVGANNIFGRDIVEDI